MSDDGRCSTCGTITNLEPRLTHAEQAHRLIDLSSGVWDSGTTSHLNRAAEIERVARAVVKRHVMPAYCSESDCAICRLRALVQPPAVGEDDGACLLRSAAPTASCVWTQDGDDCYSEGWRSDCGVTFCFDDSTPTGNGMQFCLSCGRPLIERPYVFTPEPEDGA